MSKLSIRKGGGIKDARPPVSVLDYLKPINPNALTQSLERELRSQHKADKKYDRHQLHQGTLAWLNRQQESLRALRLAGLAEASRRIPVLLQVQRLLLESEETLGIDETVEQSVEAFINRHQRWLKTVGIGAPVVTFLVSFCAVGAGIFFTSTSTALLSSAGLAIVLGLATACVLSAILGVIVHQKQIAVKRSLEVLQGIEMPEFYALEEKEEETSYFGVKPSNETLKSYWEAASQGNVEPLKEARAELLCW